MVRGVGMVEEVSITHIANTLKSLSRTGWMLKGVPCALAETVAEHSYLTSLIALDLSSRLKIRGFNIDPLKTTSLALIHDVAEAFIGDIAKTFDKLTGEVKAEVELKVAEENIKNKFLLDLYKDFTEGKTIEAKIARLCDYLATYIQAVRYEKIGFDISDIKLNMYKKILELAEDLGMKELVMNYIKHGQ